MSTYPLNAVMLKPSLFIVFFVLVLPFLIVFVALLVSTGTLNWKIPVVITAFTSLLAALLLVQLFVAKVKIEDGQVVVGGGLYKEAIRLSDIRCGELQRMDLSRALNLMGFRINGIGLPGFRFGWFQPRNGRKVFSLVTREPVVWIPTNGAYDFLISVDAVDPFMRSLCEDSRQP